MMKVAIVYDSRTGTTYRAAEAMSGIFEGHGHKARAQPVVRADPAEVSAADLICIGSWVQGLFVIMQHPTEKSMQFIDSLGDLSGKQAVVFCTYKLAAGSTLQQMARALEGKGADVVGRFKYRGPEPDEAFRSFANRFSA
jgi:flavodoxin